MRNILRRTTQRLLWRGTRTVRRYRRLRFMTVSRLICIRDSSRVHMQIAPDVAFERGVRLRLRHANAVASLTIGAGTTIGPGVEFWLGNGRIVVHENVEIRGQSNLTADGELELGAHGVYSWNTRLLATNSIRLGAHIGFAHNVTVVDSRHLWSAGADSYTEGTDTEPVRIGEGVFAGAGAVILPGAQIGRRCMVGANSVVSGTHEPGGIIVGSPARWRPLPDRLGGTVVGD